MVGNMIKADFIRSIGLGHLQNFNGTVSGAEIDTRKLQRGAAFFALKGEKSDGHTFIQNALQKGAALCVVSEQWANANPTTAPLWVVPDPESALQTLAEKWRLSFALPMLAITGTNGKTTTRTMGAAILKHKYNLHTTAGNFNNHLGLPITLLNLRPAHDFSLLEIGTNHFGEIARLCEIAHPNAGLITNIGWGHTEFFGNIKGVARAKSELFSALPSDGVAFVNADDALIATMPLECRKVTFGFDTAAADYRAKIMAYTDNGCALLNINDEINIQLAIPGRIAALNALAAATIGLYYQVDSFAIIAALEQLQPVSQRFDRVEIGPYHIINDAYNANPNSTIAAIETFRQIKAPGRKLFILGDMLELGEYSARGHASVGEAVAAAGFDGFYGTGALTGHATDAARRSGMQSVYHFPGKPELIAALKSALQPDDTLLIKGSHGSHMEEIIEGLRS